MAAVAVVKTALVVNDQVKKRVPGGWVTVVASFLVIVIASTMLIIQGVLGMVAPFLKNGDIQVCSASPTSNNSSGNQEHSDPGSGGLGGWGDQWSTARTPWPTSDSANVVYPVPTPHLASPWGYRPPFIVNGVLTPGYHNGLDFGQGLGTPVLSMADGVVAGAFKGDSLYGSHVAIKHKINGKEYTSLYGHVQGPSIIVKTGDVVKAGQQVASVGMEGMSTAPHLHFVLTVGDYSPAKSEPGMSGGAEGNTIDPLSFLQSKGAKEASGGLGGGDFSNGVTGESDTVCNEGANDESALGGDGFGSWGGYENGMIPDEVLKVIPFTGGDFKLMNIATDDLTALNDAFKAKFGRNLGVYTAYLPKSQQGSAELQGKSIYGWARAVKLNISFNTPEYDWMTQNAPSFGWEQTASYKQTGNAANAGIWGYKGKPGSGDAPLPSSANAAENQKTAQSLIKQNYPTWSNSEFTCLVKLWERESNWNQFAENPQGIGTPEGGAYGIPQSLPGNKMATMGSDWKTNPATQIKWGLNYIKERYQTPCGAWAHSESVGWY
ncbi:MAG: peptidoglycan DD-metalloendopeptidase family protein [Enterococcus sp.]|nr:peptidoglycan DD-metalloendopeptidase family protein [Enterococcus sp.]